MKKTMRHYSSWLLLLGIAVSFLAFLNGEDLYQKVKTALAEVNDYRYKNSYSMQITGANDREALLAHIMELSGNILMDNLLVKIDKEGQYHMAEILIKQDEELPYPFLLGDSKFESEKMQVIVGKGLTKNCFTKQNDNKTYISIDDKDYEVIGVVGSTNSDILDGKLIFQFNENIWDTYLGSQDVYSFCYGSNQEEIHSDIMEFYKKCNGKWNIYFEKDNSAYIEVGSRNEDEKFYWIICAFSIINCVVISEFWIIRRKQEIVVRKLWGYSNLKIFLDLYREMLLIALMAVIIVWFLQITLMPLIGTHTGIEFSWNKLWHSIIFVLVSALLVILIPIHKVSQYKPCESMEG